MSKIEDSHRAGHPGPAAAANDETAHCAVCRRTLPRATRGRPRRYCSRSCGARAYRARRADRVAGPGGERRPPRPARLTGVTIARTAVALADQSGLDGLTMRRLAGELGVATAALYRHYPDREALLAAMTELVLADHAEVAHPAPAPQPTAAQPAGTDDPRTVLAGEALREWRLYRDHPWMLPTLARLSPPLGPALFDTLEHVFAALERLGVPLDRRLTAYLALSGLVQGLALLQNSERGSHPAGIPPEAPARAEFGELVTSDLRPALHRAFSALDPAAAPDLDHLLTEAVDLLLDGLDPRHRARRVSAREPRHAPGRALHDQEPTE